MLKLLYIAVAAVGLLPGLPLLGIAIATQVSSSHDAGPTEDEDDRIFWFRTTHFTLGPVSIEIFPRVWKMLVLGVGMVLYVAGVAAMFYGGSVVRVN